MKLTRRTWIWTVVVLAGVAALAVSLRPTPLEVETADVRRGDLQITVDEEGETRLARRYVVSAPVPGRVLRIELRPGDAVVAGQTVIASLQPGDPVPLDVRTRVGFEARAKTAEASLSRARAESERARIEFERAASELKRQRTLAEADLVAKDVLEAFEAKMRAVEETLRAAQFAVRAAEFDLEQARASLLQGRESGGGRALVIRAPITGLVLKRLQESEAIVAVGTPLVELGDLRDLEVVSDLLSTDAVRVKAGAQVFIDRWGGDQPLKGRVRRIEPSGFTKISALGVEEQRVNVIIDFEDPAERRPSLGDGYRVEVRIVTAERKNVLTVPTSALFRSGSEWATFVVVGNRAARRTVGIGLRHEREAEVTSGLNEGDRVILYPAEALTDGTLVR